MNKLLVSISFTVMLLGACGSSAAQQQASAPSVASGKPATSAPASAAAKTLSNVKVGFAALSGNGTPVVVADDAGLFKKNGLPVERTVILGSPNTIAALMANEVQFTVVGASASVQAALNGADVVDVATLAPGLAFRIYSRPEIKTIQDLKGKRIVQSQQGTDPDFALQLVLKKNGMQYSDVQSIHIQGADADRLPAMQASGAEAVILGPGLFHVAEGQYHLNLLLDLIKEKIPYEQATIAVARSYTKSHPDEVLAFVKSLTEAVKYTHDHKAETLASLKGYPKTDDDAYVGEAYDYYVTGGIFPKELYVSDEGLQSLIDLVAQNNPKATGRKAAEFKDDTFVKKLSDDGFVRQLYPS